MSTPSEDHGWGAPHPPADDETAGPTSGAPGGGAAPLPPAGPGPDRDWAPPSGPPHASPFFPAGAAPPTWAVPSAASFARPSRTLSILGIVFGALAVVVLPILFGPAAIICAGIAKSRHQPLANVALGVSIAGTVAGFVLGFVIVAIR